MVMDESCTPGTGSDNPAVAGSSGVISEAALAHAPALTERTVREHGIPLEQAIQQVTFIENLYMILNIYYIKINKKYMLLYIVYN